jgi:signal transduction histidine kinase/CheY-like chemotaxis protein
MARPNGGYFWAHLAAVGAPEPEAGRDQAELRLVLSDVTERVVEVDRRQRELEEQVRQRTAALVEANRQKDEFLATMAHELRNPLTPIRTGAYLLGLRAGQDPETRQILDLITRQAAHMARMVDDLLDVSRIERGKVDLRKQAVDLGQAVAQAIETCRPVAEAGQLRLSLVQPEPLPILEADPVRLEQMLGNLLNNACKFTPAGGTIEVTAVQEGGEAVLRIRDSGTGMTADQVAHSFDLFYQGGSAMDQPRQGLGIGLTLVRQLAQLHGGSVAARSDGPGKGSEFILRLPVQPVPVRLLPAGRTDGGNPAGRSRRVLVVDDDDNVRATSVKLLEAQGYQVVMADTGEKGVELALALRPEIAIIDLGMPGLNGLEVAGRIRAALGSAIRLVAFTGFSRETDVARARAAGFDLHLAKSGDPQELLDLLREMP